MASTVLRPVKNRFHALAWPLQEMSLPTLNHLQVQVIEEDVQQSYTSRMYAVEVTHLANGLETRRRVWMSDGGMPKIIGFGNRSKRNRL